MARKSESRALSGIIYGLALTVAGLIKFLPALGVPQPVWLYFGVVLAGMGLMWWGIRNVE